MKIVIIQGYNTPYRNDLFNAISDYEDVDLTLLYISKRSENRKWQDEMLSRFREVQVDCRVIPMDYEENATILNYFDFAFKILQLRPDVVVSQLCKYTILIHYLLFWKKSRLVHWSEATKVVAKGVNWFDKLYMRLHYHLPKAYLFPGKLAKEYHEFCGLDLCQGIFFAPNSVDPIYTISEEGLSEKFYNVSPLKFLFVGSFVERKGFHILNNVYKKLKQQGCYDFELHVAGAGPVTPADGIVNHGFLSKEETIALYRSCHIFVIPSLSDCNPLSLIEAGKMGNVLLASEGCGNYPEMIDGNGYVFEIESEDSLLEKCVMLLRKTREELLAMGRKSVEVTTCITHENTAQAFHDAAIYALDQ